MQICATHPTIETGLSCGRCGLPICGRCVVATMVGTRCRACAAPDTVSRRLPRDDGTATLFGFPIPRAGWLAVAAVVLVVCPALVAWAWAEGDRERLIVRSVVYGGWIASLVLHEFCHSLVAFLGGDRDIRNRGYLTLNPFRYMDPVLSIALPTVFVLLGGIPLIGGRTLIDQGVIRSRAWLMAVSLAGPAANLAVALAIGGAFSLGLVDPFTSLGFGLAFLALLQVGAAMFNLLPVPPLDGFHAFEHVLPADFVRVARSLGFGGIFLVLFAFWLVPGLSDAFWDPAWQMLDRLGIPWWSTLIGDDLARFRF